MDRHCRIKARSIDGTVYINPLGYVEEETEAFVWREWEADQMIEEIREKNKNRDADSCIGRFEKIFLD